MKKPGAIQILLVDDDPALLEATQDIFKLFGYQTVAVSSAELALEQLKSNIFEIVLSDIRLPKMDGYQLLQEIRNTVKTQICVFLTSGHNRYSIKQMYEAGATGFFEKPMDTTTIRDTIIKSLVPRFQRWSQRTQSSDKKIELKFQSFEEMLESKKVKIGIGGLCIESPAHDFQIHQPVEFKVSFEQGVEFSGAGIIRWVDPQTQNLGLEITFLEDNCRSFICQWLNQQEIKSYIPA